jgi:hypothetical protein
MKTLFLFIFIFINTHVMSNMDKDIDFDIIESYKKPITIPAKYPTIKPPLNIQNNRTIF